MVYNPHNFRPACGHDRRTGRRVYANHHLTDKPDVDTLFFWLAKILWGALAPDSVLLLALAACLWLLQRKSYGAAKRLLAAITAVWLCIATVPIGDWLMYPLERQFAVEPALPAHVDGIIVLGGSALPLLTRAWNQPEINSHGERELAFLALARRFPQARLLFSGGSGDPLHQDVSETDTARTLFAQQGVDPSRMLLEGQSRNTYENAVNSRRLAQPQAGENWILITSAAHMPRAAGIFCAVSWPVIAWPVDHVSLPQWRLQWRPLDNLSMVIAALREWTGLLIYRISGRAVDSASCQTGAGG